MADRQTALAVFDFLDSLRAGQYRIGADAGKSWTLWKNAMKLASNVVVVVVNYVLSKRVIFRKK